MFKSLKSLFSIPKFKQVLIGFGIYLLILGTLFLLDVGFALAASMIFFLAMATIWVLRKIGVRDAYATGLFLMVLLLHIGAASFIYFADFQPFSGGQGDYESYHITAERISYFLAQGDLTIGGYFERISHYYPLIIGAVYAALFPSMIIGQFFNVWLAALAILLLYFIMREIGISRLWGLGVGLAASVYPSFVFYTSLLLKDAVVIVLVLAGLLVALRLLRHFSWPYLFLFALLLIWLTHFRFYMGIILLIVFTVSWILFSRLNIKSRLLYALVMFPLLGLIPYINGVGYYGVDRILQYGNRDAIAFYKEEVYTTEFNTSSMQEIPAVLVKKEKDTDGEPVKEGLQDVPETEIPVSDSPKESDTDKAIGTSSTVDLHISFESPTAFARTFAESFAFTSIGPFPWQFTAGRHYLVLLETIPWLVAVFFIGWGVVRSWKNDKRALMLLLFAVGVFSLLSIFFSNFGVITRIRIPAFLALLPFIQ